MVKAIHPPKPRRKARWVWLWGVILHRGAMGTVYPVTPVIPLRSLPADPEVIKAARRALEAKGYRFLAQETVAWEGE